MGKSRDGGSVRDDDKDVAFVVVILGVVGFFDVIEVLIQVLFNEGVLGSAGEGSSHDFLLCMTLLKVPIARYRQVVYI